MKLPLFFSVITSCCIAFPLGVFLGPYFGNNSPQRDAAIHPNGVDNIMYATFILSEAEAFIADAKSSDDFYLRINSGKSILPLGGGFFHIVTDDTKVPVIIMRVDGRRIWWNYVGKETHYWLKFDCDGKKFDGTPGPSSAG